MFGFTLKRSLVIFFVVNISTQIILNIIVLYSNITNGLFAGFFMFIIAEIFIVFIELTIYLKYLTEKTVQRRIAYGIFANIASCVIGCMLFFM
jgi:hypothetical protein